MTKPQSRTSVEVGREVSPSGADGTNEESHVDLSGAMVVVLDDDPAVCRALSRSLKAMGCCVNAFTEPRVALESTSIAEAECLLLDLAMPEMSGLELQEFLSQRGSTAPVIFLSGHGDIPSTVRAMRNGALDFLEKPVEAASLREAVAAAVERSRQAAEQAGRLQTLVTQYESLTERQREVFAGVVSGEPNKVIGHRMSISERTVKAHRREVMIKLGAGSVTELVNIANALKG